MTQHECFKVASEDKVLPGISDTLKEHRDAVNILGFSKSFWQSFSKTLKEVMLPLVKKGKGLFMNN